MKYASGESCTFHLDIPADASCSRCERPFCRACLTLMAAPPPTTAESGISIGIGNLGGLVCIECKIKGEARGALVSALVGIIWLFMGLAFISSVPAFGRAFFLMPMTFFFLIGLGFTAFGLIRYFSKQEKLRRFQESLPLKAKFPSKVELGVAECPICGGHLKKVPRKTGDIVLCEYCGAPIIAQEKI